MVKVRCVLALVAPPSLQGIAAGHDRRLGQLQQCTASSGIGTASCSSAPPAAASAPPVAAVH